MNNWHTIKLDQHSTKGKVRAYVDIDAQSLWFSGHFPGEPILPGFAVLSMVFDAIYLATSGSVIIKGFKKIRFKHIIKPCDQLEIEAKTSNNVDTYTFYVKVDGIHACKGTLFIDHIK